ncbi:MAG: hypothetical protein R3F14_01460 [Polyangiaceae bacterium]
MVRTIAILVAAITMSRPTIPKEEATRYAKVLNEIGSKYDFDPLYAVAMVHWESHWMPAVSSDDGEDFGLGQVRARYVGACRTDEDPVGNPSDACKAVKAQLLTAEANLRQVGVIIGANKKMCAEKRGKNKPEYWIAGYQGLSHPERNKYCVPGPTTTRVMDYHKELVASLFPSSKTKKGTAIAGKPPAGKDGKSAVAAKAGVSAKAGVGAAKTASASTAAKSTPASTSPSKSGAAAKTASLKPTGASSKSAPAKTASKPAGSKSAAKPSKTASAAKASTKGSSPAKASQSKATGKGAKATKQKKAQAKPAPQRKRQH